MAETSSVSDSAPPAEGEIRRDLGKIGLLFAGVGSIIGSGWLLSALNAAHTAGPASIVSWCVATVMILLIGLCFAELGTMFPISGGVVRFPHLSFGSFASYTMGFITWVAAVSVAPIELEAALQYATKYAPLTTKHMVDGEPAYTLTAIGMVFAVVGLALFVVLNYIGVRYFAQINNVAVWWKLAVIILVIFVFLFTTVHGENFTKYGFFSQGWNGVFSAIPTAGIVFSFLGFRQGVELAGETKNPKFNVPFAVIGSIVLCGIIYIALEVAFLGAVRPSDLATSHGWAKLAFENDFGPLASIATILGLGWLATLLYVDAVISPADTGFAYSAVTARISYAMGKNRNAPQSLTKVNKQGVPWFSLVVAFVVGLIFFLPFPNWQSLVSFITSSTVMSFGSGPLVLACMRRQLPDHPRPFRLPGGDLIPFLAFYSSNMILFWAGWDTNKKIGVCILIGFVLWPFFHNTSKGRAPAIDWKAGASWVLPWIIGEFVISYLSEYGNGIGLIGMGWGFLVQAIFSAVIFAIALSVRFSPQRVQEQIAETEAAVKEEEAELSGSGA